MKFCGRLLDALERGKVQLKPNGLFAGLLRQLRNCSFGACLASCSNVHLRVLPEERLMSEVQGLARRHRSPRGDGYLAYFLANAGVSPGDDDNLSR